MASSNPGTYPAVLKWTGAVHAIIDFPKRMTDPERTITHNMVFNNL